MNLATVRGVDPFRLDLCEEVGSLLTDRCNGRWLQERES